MSDQPDNDSRDPSLEENERFIAEGKQRVGLYIAFARALAKAGKTLESGDISALADFKSNIDSSDPEVQRMLDLFVSDPSHPDVRALIENSRTGIERLAFANALISGQPAGHS